MIGSLHWYESTPAARAAAEAAFVARSGDELDSRADDSRITVLHDNVRRCVIRIDHAGERLVIKRFRTASGRHRLRESLKSTIGRDPAQREWRALRRAHDAGVAVATPLGFGRLPDGDPVLVLGWVEGVPFEEAYRRAAPCQRRALQRALGRAIARLHAAGLAHGDLQHGNVRVGEQGPVLLDLQRARRARERARVGDLGFLAHSLQGFVPASGRWRILRAALGAPESELSSDGSARPGLACASPEPALRGWWTAVRRAADARENAHARSRTRHALRPGRAFAIFRHGGAQGLRVADFSEADARRALDAHHALIAAGRDEARPADPGEPCVLQHSRRSAVSRVRAGSIFVVVKETPVRGPARALADLVRGCAGWRAFRGGHGLHARGVGAARPLAFVEERRFGCPRRSCVVLEDLSADLPADRALGANAEAFGLTAHTVLEALGALVIALHRAGVRHGDLKASHVWLRVTPNGVETRLVDLDAVRFRPRATPANRRLELAQLNASLPDGFDAASRRAAFARYVRRLPFECGATEALGAIVAASLARRHRWSGADCALASSAEECASLGRGGERSSQASRRSVTHW